MANAMNDRNFADISEELQARGAAAEALSEEPHEGAVDTDAMFAGLPDEEGED